MDSQIISAVMDDLNLDFGNPFPVLIGERHIAENDSWPRIVWIPRSDVFGPSSHGGYNPRQLATDSAHYEIHIWERDIDSTRALMHQLMGALHRQASAFSYQPDGAEWITAGEFCNNGCLVVLSINFKIPVVDRKSPTIRPETITASMAASRSNPPQFNIMVTK